MCGYSESECLINIQLEHIYMHNYLKEKTRN